MLASCGCQHQSIIPTLRLPRGMIAGGTLRRILTGQAGQHATGSLRAQCFSSSSTVMASMPPAGGPQPSPAGVPESRGKYDLVSQLLAAKEASGKTFTQISKELGLTNAFTAQLFHNQAQLKSGREELLRKACPALTDELISAMKRAPMRGYDPSILKEPHIYRMTEAVTHYGESIKAIMNEEVGDGIMSAIDMYATVRDAP
ncbi:hypothetical protein ABBQ38_013449 [Trebouxia sp. C0009 RCD-2024]